MAARRQSRVVAVVSLEAMKSALPHRTTLRWLLFSAVTAASIQLAGAFNYNDGDLLLVFRKDGFNDVEFNLGSVSNYLGLANGARRTVSNWDASLVRSNFNNSLASVRFLLLSATSVTDPLRRIWGTSANLAPHTPPTDLSGSRWGALRSKINFMGSEATAVSVTNASQIYIAAASDSSSYTFIASDGGQLDATTVGGLAPFPVDTENPATLLFYEVKISNLAVKPPAPILGSFCLDGGGNLTYTAGPLTPLPRPAISLTRSGNNSTISFLTTNCGNYRLVFATDIGGPWTVGASSVAGDGTVKTLTDSTSGAQRFYEVQVTP